MSRIDTIVLVSVILIMLGTIGGIAYGIHSGTAATKEAMERAEAQRTTVEAKILEIIVQRNPDAAIKDFASFPAHLLAVSADARIDFRLAMALIDAESEWRPRAIGSKGEIGLMQVLPSTAALVAKRLGLPDYKAPVTAKHGYADLGSLGDPKQNVLIGLTFLAWQRDSFGSGPVMLRAFNRGPSRAREHWPADAYVNRVGLRLVGLVQAFQ